MKYPLLSESKAQPSVEGPQAMPLGCQGARVRAAQPRAGSLTKGTREKRWADPDCQHRSTLWPAEGATGPRQKSGNCDHMGLKAPIPRAPAQGLCHPLLGGPGPLLTFQTAPWVDSAPRTPDRAPWSRGYRWEVSLGVLVDCSGTSRLSRSSSSILFPSLRQCSCPPLPASVLGSWAGSQDRLCDPG